MKVLVTTLWLMVFTTIILELHGLGRNPGRSRKTVKGGNKKPRTGGNFAQDKRKILDLPPLHKGRVKEAQPTKLLDFLIQVFAGGKRNQAKLWLSNTLVSVNEMPQTAYDYELREHDLVVIKAGKGSPSTNFPDGLKVINNDASIIVVDKPCGYYSTTAESLAPTKATSLKTKKISVQQILSSYLRRKYGSQSPDKLVAVSPLEENLSGKHYTTLYHTIPHYNTL